MPLGCNANHAARDVTLSGGAPTGPPPELPPPPPCTYEVQEYIICERIAANAIASNESCPLLHCCKLPQWPMKPICLRATEAVCKFGCARAEGRVEGWRTVPPTPPKMMNPKTETVMGQIFLNDIYVPLCMSDMHICEHLKHGSRSADLPHRYRSYL